MEERNFDLLRPFDLEAAKRGEQLMRVLAGEWMDVTFVAEGGDDGDHGLTVTHFESGKRVCDVPHHVVAACLNDTKAAAKMELDKLIARAK